MRVPRVGFRSWKLLIPIFIVADSFALWVWAARPPRVYGGWFGLVGRPQEGPIARLAEWARNENGPRTPSGFFCLFEHDELYFAGALLFALILLILIALASRKSGNRLWLRLSAPVRAARAVAVRFRVRTALAAIAILGLYLGWEIHAWRTWRARWSFLMKATEAARGEGINRSSLYPIRESLAKLDETDLSKVEDLVAPEIGVYRSKAAVLAERLATRARLEQEARYLSAMIAACAERKHKYERAAANPWAAVAPDQPMPKQELDAETQAASWLITRDYARALAGYDDLARASPDLVDAHLNSAWLRATCPDARFRDGKRAIASATRACELTNWQDTGALGTLAAACAEAGDFAAAVKWQQKVLELITHGPRPQFYLDRLALYKAGKPFRQQ